jgi:hypothetical protein
MALKRNPNGGFTIKNDKQLKEALAQRTEIQAVLEDDAYLEMMKEVTELSRAAAEYMTRRDIEEIPFVSDKRKFRAVAVQRYNSMWIGDDDDVPADPGIEPVRSLRSVLSNDQWAMVTKRTVDEAKLDEAVRSGKIKEEEIRQCLYEKPQTPYVRVYENR